MTKRSECAHRLAEFKTRLMVSVAGRLFSQSRKGLDGFVKRLMKVDQSEPYTDPDLEHPE